MKNNKNEKQLRKVLDTPDGLVVISPNSKFFPIVKFPKLTIKRWNEWNRIKKLMV